MSFKITIDKKSVRLKIENRWTGKVAAPLTEQVIKDSNFYCRKDVGTLIDSSQRASDPAKGLAVWDTPYARRVYYTGTPSTDVNPNASLMWCEKAKGANKKTWENIAQKAWDG